MSDSPPQMFGRDGKSLLTVASDRTSDVWIAHDDQTRRINASKSEGMYGMPRSMCRLMARRWCGSPRKKLTNFDERSLFSFTPLRSGKGWALARGELSRDAVLITGFR